MGAKRLLMRQILEILRLKYEQGLGHPGHRRGLWCGRGDGGRT
jgi:hypothetical protein